MCGAGGTPGGDLAQLASIASSFASNYAPKASDLDTSLMEMEKKDTMILGSFAYSRDAAHHDGKEEEGGCLARDQMMPPWAPLLLFRFSNSRNTSSPLLAFT